MYLYEILILFISDSGLTLSSSEAIAFGEFAELRCTENDTVTNDGFVTKLKCLPNGKFQTRKWNDNKCRERKICSKSPPRPPAETGLARNYSRDVKEFGYAGYNCISSHQVNASTYLYTLQLFIRVYIFFSIEYLSDGTTDIRGKLIMYTIIVIL